MTNSKAPSVIAAEPAQAPPPQTSRVACALPAGVQRLTSHAILQGAQEIEIEHNGAVYRLRQTSQGKLILTK
ncbi:hemin uptake protein HemP [Candidatus Aalborgicola defluviihabitans]|uniref:hemin uptake protein HemP n=1 Tax=Candidatus Aalborgicola defluviihabitans TaxID=3386187 RepID=UPI001EB644C5|nr:hemin uptake protein HemP [Burkholderiales bacterium]MBK7282683.1 hemin uptake protein HemP [Burkholderiales bacterium]